MLRSLHQQKQIVLFMFISQLPMSRMDALKGKVTLVPIQGEDIVKTVAAGQALPRTPTDTLQAFTR